MPEKWKWGLLLHPIYKKEVCENYRGILLLNITYKMLSSLLYTRLNIYT